MPLAASAFIVDPDSPNFYPGKLTVAAVSGAAAVNRLEVGGEFSVSGAKVLWGSAIVGWIHSNGYGSNSLSITFTEHATRSIVQQLVRSLRFRTYNAANTFDRTFEITLLDSAGSSGSKAEVQAAVRES